jgi:hypothetical protein
MDAVSNWMWVDIFTVEQAAALWCNFDPAELESILSRKPPELSAAKQMLTSGILSGELKADSSTNGMRIIGNYAKSLVARADLEAFARKRNLYPAFLFDTLAPFGDQKRASPVVIAPPASSSSLPLPPPEPMPLPIKVVNKGGRPAEYDWDSFLMEIVHRANQPDGLPDTQADLVREMLSWFSERFGAEPAESSVKQRISKIYNYLSEAKNRTK